MTEVHIYAPTVVYIAQYRRRGHRLWERYSRNEYKSKVFALRDAAAALMIDGVKRSRVLALHDGPCPEPIQICEMVNS